MKKRFDRVFVSSAIAGHGDEVAQVKLLIGPRGSHAEKTFCERMVASGMGVESLLVTLEPNLRCLPSTLMVNHNPLTRPMQNVLFYGPARSALAQAVTRFALDSGLGGDELTDLFLVASVFIHPDAGNNDRVFVQNRQAVGLALQDLLKQSAGDPPAAHLSVLQSRLRRLSDESGPAD